MGFESKTWPSKKKKRKEEDLGLLNRQILRYMEGEKKKKKKRMKWHMQMQICFTTTLYIKLLLHFV